MTKFQTVFGKPRVFLPVIHCKDEAQTRRNAQLAVENGADGVWLINQGGMYVPEILRSAQELANTVPFVGVNLLGRDLETMLFTAEREGLHGIWTDDTEHKRFDVKAIWFGSCAFKYKRYVPPSEYGSTAKAAVAMGVDVVTTSGLKTGQPPDVEKVRAMSEALAGHLAIASGITPENVDAFLPFAQAYLVATGIEKEFGEFNAGRVRELADKIHQA